jgi:exonuclease VII large subunit
MGVIGEAIAAQGLVTGAEAARLGQCSAATISRRRTELGAVRRAGKWYYPRNVVLEHRGSLQKRQSALRADLRAFIRAATAAFERLASTGDVNETRARLLALLENRCCVPSGDAQKESNAVPKGIAP